MCLKESDNGKEWWCHFHDTQLQISSTGGLDDYEGSRIELFMFVCSCFNDKMSLYIPSTENGVVAKRLSTK